MSRKLKNICASCGGKRRSGHTTFTAELGSGIVVVRSVPALVCSQCGEDWINDEVAERLENIVKQAKKSGRQVEISSYEKKAS